MRLHRGTRVLLRKKDELRQAEIKLVSHKGQALELKFDDGGSLILFQDERHEWQDPTGAHWELQIAPLAKPLATAAVGTQRFQIAEGSRDRSSYGGGQWNEEALGNRGVKPWRRPS